MGKLRSFLITLDSSQDVYFAGQIISGKLVVELDAQMHMREIRLKFKGVADVHWTETETTGTGSNQRTETVSYTAHESYFEQRVPVYGKGVGMGEDNCLPPGQHVYPFTFQLPPNIPSSFEGGEGFVRYSIKGTIDKPWKFDHDTKRLFTVASPLDLNEYPNAANEVQNQKQKFICCCCCKSGPLSGMIRLNRSGFVPGETLDFITEILNMSSRDCTPCVRLCMLTLLHATSKTKTLTREICRQMHDTVLPGDSEVRSASLTQIPPLPPSFLVGCSIIDINYVLELVLEPSGPAYDLHVPVPVIIGSVPLVSVFRQHQTQYGVPSIHEAPPPAFPSTEAPPPAFPSTEAPPPAFPSKEAPPPAFPSTEAPPPIVSSAPSELPPPSYSECVFGKTNIREVDDTEYTRGEMNYAPAYAYYDWSKQTQFK
uniref:Arrestin domain-containing protein 17-like n=1 Tax=Crassostrea virginica TaxID=6565 RepID=A0A8B8DPY9_CRAVI|nr:arrestin domain-containing protein 17-like [Crassostrea virginica]XP_022329046.1 arrestin domain-containing protein 17-like [Crassostrea virginica]XP_022329047.1 arrestin domain-containing protein 17-like [Crassostrea virginica]